MTSPLIEFRVRRTGQPLLDMPLYDFLKSLHCQSSAADEFRFEELQIILDGDELLPSECGHA
jgi:hypothetical protein